MPGKPFQSKLEPFYGFIRECRTKRWSYARIAEALTRDHGMRVSANAVFSFVKVRAKGRKLYTLPAQTAAGSIRPEHHATQAASEDPKPLASQFFTLPDEPSKTPPKQTKHEKRPYRLDF
jgi:hypothetical protein